MTTWTSTPIADVVAGLALAGYLAAVLRLAKLGSRWPVGRTACWLAAVLVLLISVHSSIEVYGHALLWVHMIQHLLLIMVVPVLLVWGQPIRLIQSMTRRARPPRGFLDPGGSDPGGSDPRGSLGLGGRLARVALSPVVAMGGYTAVLVGTHLTGFPELMVTSPWVHHVEVALYLVSGYLLFLPLVGAEASPRHIPHVGRFAVLALAMGADTLVGVGLMLTDRPLAPSTMLMRAGWGPTLLQDQGAAGAIMWVGGDTLMLVLMLVVAAQWSAGGQQARLGDWLEAARSRSLAGIGSGSSDDRTAVDESPDVDADEAARAAYNRMLADLHRHPPPN